MKVLAAAVLALLLLLASVGGSYWLSDHHFDEVLAAQHRQAEQQQAEQRRQGAALEVKLCRTLLPLVPLASLQAPAGSPVTNPSRGYEQELSRTLRPLANLAPDLGCR